MFKIKRTETFSMNIYNEKGTWWTGKKIHCNCNFGIVKMSTEIPRNLDLYPTID
jgi:hypothetical protein